MESYSEHELRTKVDAALRRIRSVLENTRNPQYPADVPHRYEDKYLLAEVQTRVATASLLQCLEVIGMSAPQLAKMREWARTRSVTIRLLAHEDCGFLREESRKVESPHEHVTEVRGLLGGKVTKTEKIVTTVTEYLWGFDFEYEIIAFQGTATEEAITLHARKGSVQIKTAAKTTPRPRTVVRPPVDVNVTWLLTHLDAEGRSSFAIDRTDTACHTPRRNKDVDAALRAFDEMYGFCARVGAYFRGELFPAQPDHGLDLAAINADEVLVPVLPLFEGNARDEGVLPAAYAHAFLAEERRSLVEKCRALSAAFPRNATVVTAVEAGLLVTHMHIQEVCRAFASGVAYIEGMLRKQLVSAIGKEVTPADFNAYMEFHHRKLVAPPYRPQPFSYAIRRPDHYPEGVLAIEADRGGAMPDAISTTVAHSAAQRPMSFALDASTRVSFLGERHLHAWISHQFSGQPGPSLSLVARARQFSSFLLLVGRIASADMFEPRFGIIVQNKDLVKIPLMLEQIPTPKEFRDAIESLSPEQQRFARAFRGMQLESTLFGVCVIQIKPQLEKLLKLPPDSLTKEIRMTQELLNLFLEYQIPSDLLSYDGPPEASADEKLARVREYIAKMQEMIGLSKQREIEEEREREALRLAELNRTDGGHPFGPPPPAFAPPPSMMAPKAAPMPAGRSRVATPAAAAPAPARAASPAPPPAPPPAAPPPPPAPAPAAAKPSEAAASTGTSGESASHRHDAQAAAPIAADGGEVVDYTRIPAALDRKFEALDEDGALRATIINPGDVWTRSAQKGLLGAQSSASLSSREQKDEKNKAFDLLDALSKSGALAIEDASLHVVIAATHCFDRTLLDTVIQANVNPIEKVERSLMIVGTTIHGRPAAELLAEDQRERFFTTSPQLGPARDG
jgi:hypothetical protein